jgi:ABC-type phosphate/phosphonate transport system substrate-binding protein
MASITIHDIDRTLNERLTDESRRRNRSKNQLIKEILSREMGLPVGVSYADDYSEFCGVWTAAEAAEFAESQKELSQVDPGDWRE